MSSCQFTDFKKHKKKLTGFTRLEKINKIKADQEFTELILKTLILKKTKKLTGFTRLEKINKIKAEYFHRVHPVNLVRLSVFIGC